jgi:hypothetical protein
MHTSHTDATDIRAFGAVGDGQTLNTQAIQRAIDACHAQGGGKVAVRRGAYLTGTICLKSNVLLEVEAGARLMGSPDIRDYGLTVAGLHYNARILSMGMIYDRCLIYAEDAENIGLVGGGTIDGQGGLVRKVFPNPDDPQKRRPMLVRFSNCRGITLRDVTLLDPACFTAYFVRCRDMRVEGITIHSRHTPNGDGLDFDGGEDVLIANCHLDCGDDAISLKPMHPDWPSQRFLIHNCVMTTEWAAIRLGPESRGDLRDIVVSNCVFHDCRDGLKIQSGEGAVMENLLFSNLIMHDVNRPLFVTLNRFSFSAHEASARPPIGGLRNIQCSNIRAIARRGDPTNPFDQPCVAVVALPGAHIENVTLQNVHLTMPGGGQAADATRLEVPELLDFAGLWPETRHFEGSLPSAAIYLRHVRGIALRAVRLDLAQPDARPFIAGDDIDGLDLRDVVGVAAAETPGLAKLADTREVTLRDCRLLGDAAAECPLLLPLTADEAARLAAHRARAAALDAALQAEANAVDCATRATLLATLPAVWHFRRDPLDEGMSAGWFAAEPAQDWGKLRVDQPWTEQGHEHYAGIGWYSVTIDAPSCSPGQRVYLYLSGLRGACRVWVNAQLAGERDLPPGYMDLFPLALDVTNLVQRGVPARIVVRAAGNSGLYRTVEWRVSEPPQSQEDGCG